VRLLAFLLLASAQAALAQPQVYPVRPITLVIPFAPNGAADITGRLLAERMSGVLQQPVVVQNRPGRGGMIATTQVSGAPADGYTLLYVTSATFVVAPLFERIPKYDPLSSFEPITLVSFVKSVIAVNPAVPAKNLDELMALLKASPGKYRYATSGPGGHSYMTGELFKTQTGMDIVDVPFRGPIAAVEAVASGNADILFELAVLSRKAAADGRVRPIVTMGFEREPLFPQVPATAELGMRDLTSYFWGGIVAPAGTPPTIVEVINRAVRSVLSEMEAQATFLRYSMQAETSTPQEFHNLIQGELTKWSRVVPLSATAPR